MYGAMDATAAKRAAEYGDPRDFLLMREGSLRESASKPSGSSSRWEDDATDVVGPMDATAAVGASATSTRAAEYGDLRARLARLHLYDAECDAEDAGQELIDEVEKEQGKTQKNQNERNKLKKQKDKQRKESKAETKADVAAEVTQAQRARRDLQRINKEAKQNQAAEAAAAKAEAERKAEEVASARRDRAWERKLRMREEQKLKRKQKREAEGECRSSEAEERREKQKQRRRAEFELELRARILLWDYADDLRSKWKRAPFVNMREARTMWVYEEDTRRREQLVSLTRSLSSTLLY